MRETTITVRGESIRLFEAGSGAAVVYLHGIDGPLEDPFVHALAATHRVLMPELPGFSRSTIPAWMMSTGDAAFFGLDLIEALKLHKVHLVGHSIGGWIAAEMAIRSTQRLASLTLLAPAGVCPADAPAEDVFLLGGEKGIRAQFHDPALAEAEIAARASQQIDIELQNRTGLARLAWTPRMASVQLPVWLHRIDVPTLLVWGDADRIVPVSCAQTFRREIPACELVVLSGCGHAIGFERGAQAAQRVVNFMSGAVR